jgi:hypothetical protein
VSNIASKFRTIFNCCRHDWHMDAACEALPQASNDTTQGSNFGPPGSRPAVDAQHRNATLPDQASTPILRDDRFAVPQDEHRGRRRKSKVALIQSRPQSGRPSKDERVLTCLTTRTSRQPHRLSSRKPRSGYPGPMRPQPESAKWVPARATLGRDDNRERLIAA